MLMYQNQFTQCVIVAIKQKYTYLPTFLTKYNSYEKYLYILVFFWE